MRTLMIATAGLAALVGADADAQRMIQHGPGASYGVPGAMRSSPQPPIIRPAPIGPGQVHRVPGGSRWGSKIGGRWWGGANAPGGWGGYRRPHRGWALPRYWVAPRFAITDWSTYGLAQPPYGYSWSRYYDDAVLVDNRGSVYDTVPGVDWDRYDTDGGYATEGHIADGYATNGYATNGYAANAYPANGYAPATYARDERVYAGPDDRGYRGGYDRRDTGVGGAVIGGVVGGVAGNVIAGRGNRLGGTLIGAGVGAAAGYAIDKSEDRGRVAPPPPPPPPPRGYAPAPGYGAGYPAPVYHGGYPGPVRAAGGSWVSSDGATTVTTTSGYGGGSTTTVVVQPAPVVTTTTTTEYYEDAVTYTRAPRTVWHKKRVWRPRPRCGCR